MSLLHPSPGEVIDRLEIVRLKRAAYEKAGKDTTKLTEEGIELAIYLRKFPIFARVKTLTLQLADTHKKLWQSEDDVRVKGASDIEVTRAALNIFRLNDLRCQLVRQIDQAHHVESIEEKIYATGIGANQ